MLGSPALWPVEIELPPEHASSEDIPEVTKRIRGPDDFRISGTSVCVKTCVEVTLSEYVWSKASRMPAGVGFSRMAAS